MFWKGWGQTKLNRRGIVLPKQQPNLRGVVWTINRQRTKCTCGCHCHTWLGHYNQHKGRGTNVSVESPIWQPMTSGAGILFWRNSDHYFEETSAPSMSNYQGEANTKAPPTRNIPIRNKEMAMQRSPRYKAYIRIDRRTSYKLGWVSDTRRFRLIAHHQQGFDLL